MDSKSWRSLNETVKDIINRDHVLDEIIIHDTYSDKKWLIKEGKWIQQSKKSSIRVDQPTHGIGQAHAHIYGRKGKEIGVVNLDGTSSHGTKMIIDKDRAETLRAHGFNIPKDRIVEWVVNQDLSLELLLE